MKGAAERAYIAGHACVPEHLPAYVAAITGGRPHLVGDFVVYTCVDRLIFVGYPLSGLPESAGAGRLRNGSRDREASPWDFQSPAEETAWLAALAAATARFRPRLVALTAAALPPGLAGCSPSSPDAYYRLDLARVQPDKKVRNLLRRAEREVTVRQVPIMGQEHRRLVDEFLAAAPVDDGTRFIFERLPRYAGPKGAFQSIASALRVWPGRGRTRTSAEESPPPRSSAFVRIPYRDPDTAISELGQPLILEARDADGRLAAFDIAAFGGDYAFYLFNFRSRQCYVPGASDLLLARLIAEGQARGKRYLNLGLGINAGVRHFKEKWGAAPFLPHVACVQERPVSAWEEMLAGV